jgi:maleylacetoacetate isomerase
MSPTTSPKLTLHTFYRSSCCARLRIALNHKQIPFSCVYVDLNRDEHHSESHKKLNPSQSVPVLIVSSKEDRDHESSFSVGQSVAALEYLEEAYPETPTLFPAPSGDPVARAAIRSLVQIIVSDIQPVTSTRTLKRVKESGADANAWARAFTNVGFAAYESAVSKTAGKYSYGDEISIADCCLVPAVWGAQRFDIDMKPFPKLGEIYARLMEEPAVQKAHWRNQEDTPEEFRI